jgi:hypothetical protein
LIIFIVIVIYLERKGQVATCPYILFWIIALIEAASFSFFL